MVLQTGSDRGLWEEEEEEEEEEESLGLREVQGTERLSLSSRRALSPSLAPAAPLSHPQHSQQTASIVKTKHTHMHMTL